MQSLTESLQIAPREVIAIVGAGGLTGASLRLVADLREHGRRVLSTSTVFTQDVHPLEPFFFLVEPNLDVAKEQITSLLSEHGHVRLATERIRADKIRGVEPEWLPALAEIPEADNIVVQADGARHRALKAPREGEPAMPARADVVLVMTGLDVLGKPLDEENVHRPEQVAALTGLGMGEPVTPEAVAAVLSHPQGGLKSIPRNARAWFVLTGWTPDNDAVARTIAAQALANAPQVRGALLLEKGHGGFETLKAPSPG